MTHFVHSADGTQIAFDDLGPTAAPAVILVHGATAYRAISPSAAALAAAGGLRVVTYDRRGRGESGDAETYAVAREIEDIAALLEHVGGDAILLGESSGAILALEAALAGVPVSAVAAFEPPFIVDDARPPIPADYVARLDAFAAAGDRLGALRYFSLEAVGLPPEMVDQMMASPFISAVEPYAGTLRYDARIVGDTMSGDPAALDRYVPIPPPVTVLVGESTFPSIRSGAAALAEVLPDSRLVVVPGGDHQLPADDVAPILRSIAVGV
ncbi:pimeloyl-ACP methyl ester carboxylesterase [Agromyces hippuratus]|uniref:Pimeloyl-ACP methyl ester carboxylesterase n=1 Tax=Agromyces hippuratus TaxID=286438 RepID=A0A852X183_9MICO|nr:alpha/beta fold hydrolase [Agromyces hippuratus]NYG19885.1 pimeloyl-ACP methyl ester carboxylesterase [Agromyces hippuratus]